MGPKPILTREEERTVAAIMSAGSRRPPASIGELRLRLMGDPTVSVSEAAYRIKVSCCR
ncbi:MAG: hypothetical protein IH968_05890 [Gemmatimonadetes bacterium]|nr:hypothetical protein [Gemmatimonadota bacterium]